MRRMKVLMGFVGFVGFEGRWFGRFELGWFEVDCFEVGCFGVGCFGVDYSRVGYFEVGYFEVDYFDLDYCFESKAVASEANYCVGVVAEFGQVACPQPHCSAASCLPSSCCVSAVKRVLFLTNSTINSKLQSYNHPI